MRKSQVSIDNNEYRVVVEIHTKYNFSYKEMSWYLFEKERSNFFSKSTCESGGDCLKGLTSCPKSKLVLGFNS